MGSWGGLGGCWKGFGGVLEGSGGVFEGSTNYTSAKGVDGHVISCNMLGNHFFFTISNLHIFRIVVLV